MAQHTSNRGQFNRPMVFLELVASIILAIIVYEVIQFGVNLSFGISACLLFLSASIYFASLLITDASGGLDSQDEERMLYTAIMGIAIVLFAAISQLHIGIKGAVATLGMAVIITLSAATRFASHLKWFRQRPSLSSKLVDGSWITIIFIALLGFYLLAFTPI